jgi:hypothetical protein
MLWNDWPVLEVAVSSWDSKYRLDQKNLELLHCALLKAEGDELPINAGCMALVGV